MKISVFGTGYVGLVTGTCLAELGHEVMCMDIDKEKIEQIRQGHLPIYEAGLQELVERNMQHERLFFTSDAREAVMFGRCLFNAVGTPPDKEHGDKADLQYIFSVASVIGSLANEYKLLVNKSTVPVGTADACKKILTEALHQRGVAFQIDVASNPEFLREGAAVKDFLNPDRIVCGVETQKAKELLIEVYAPLTRDYSGVFFTDVKSAEIIKYASNAFLATKISFINEIASFVEKVGGNISDISRGMGMDKRIGPKFLHAGIGYGGSCFPKDIKALMASGREVGYEFNIVSATEKVNDQQKLRPLKVLDTFDFAYNAGTIGILGLAFKPRTDDVREAPSLGVVSALLEKGVRNLRLYDPIAMDNFAKEFPEDSTIRYHRNLYETAVGCDALIVLTEWDEFRGVNFEKLQGLMQGDILLDGRNIRNRFPVDSYGFRYVNVGKRIESQEGKNY